MKNHSDMPFSLVIGGPFYRLQKKFGLLGEDLLPSTAAAVIFVGVVWLPLALLSIAEGAAWNNQLDGSGFFLDYSGYARFIVAIFMLTFMERIADRRTGIVLRQFLNGEVIDDGEYVHFRAALKKPDVEVNDDKFRGSVDDLYRGARLYGAFFF